MLALWPVSASEPTQHSDLDALERARAGVVEPVLWIVPRELVGEALKKLHHGDDLEVADVPASLLAHRRARMAAGVERLDALTGALHRRAFRELTSAALASAAPEHPVSLVLVNIDHFKAVNDEHGHAAGDQMLRELAELLMTTKVAGSEIARVGGETFGVLFDLDGEAAREEAERMVARGREARFAGELRVTVSAGAATARAPMEPDALYRAAEEALYAAKARGRDRALHADELAEEAYVGDVDRRIAGFEEFTRVVAERVADVISRRGTRILRELRQQADVDTLTGAFNRRYLDHRLPFEVERAREQRAPLTIAMLDLDHFGEVNKKYGWPTGDRLLAAVADAVRKSIREDDWVARYGGEELCLVLAAPLASVEPILERVLAAVAAASVRAPSGESVAITASLGAVEAAVTDDALSILERASARLIEAKNAGRNRLVV
ncbi:MAG: GGDEF domain-containing protein [Sandaracinaceae bacterium]|nr:GGDEF domain-containing protein [Sandaracinaceae bacterium]